MLVHTSDLSTVAESKGSKLNGENFQAGNLAAGRLPHDVRLRKSIVGRRGWIYQFQRIIGPHRLDGRAAITEFAGLDFIRLAFAKSRRGFCHAPGSAGLEGFG